ncbi:hypothetical protein VRU48_10815 [Pedobacter sp. KR3-3]|uniref:Uncharacterized protein n=1 Tax=Pedobacter albus TaxID=3113905 RepID=A0ABU7I803_9SPHI|nr:hypothetical protein [Pedobacter sp. KR3-3]MEE1945597.1 hypothetical protein [Pedobacter sp. KR3-3]
MSNSTNEPKRATDKLHADSLGETKDLNELSYDKNKKSFEYDMKSTDSDYDHPLNYDTVSMGAVNDDSTYDEANPYVGDEYAGKEEIADDELDELGMHVDNEGESVLLSPEDEILGRTEEDYRDDLDEEGYPKNNGY